LGSRAGVIDLLGHGSEGKLPPEATDGDLQANGAKEVRQHSDKDTCSALYFFGFAHPRAQ